MFSSVTNIFVKCQKHILNGRLWFPNGWQICVNIARERLNIVNGNLFVLQSERIREPFNGKQWKIMENNGKQWKTLENKGWTLLTEIALFYNQRAVQWKAMENNGKQKKTKENIRKQRLNIVNSIGQIWQFDVMKHETGIIVTFL